MSKIEIREVDLTTIEQAPATTDDIVYIPGFSSLANSENAALPKEPILCTTVAEFVNKFGDKPAVFIENQPYPNDGETNHPTYYFSANAMPAISSGYASMFLEGDYDPSYIYARELLALGIPVVYERVNTIGEAIVDGYADEVSVDNMYKFLEENFIYQNNLSCDGSTGVTVVFVSASPDTTGAAGKATFVQHFDEVGRYKFINVGKTAININYPITVDNVIHKTNDKFVFTLERDTFITTEAYSGLGTYIFTATVSGSTITWSDGTNTVDLSTIGITNLSVKPGSSPITSGDEIVIQTIANGWKDNRYDNVIYSQDYLGLTISGTLTDESFVIVVYSKEEPKLVDKNLYTIKYLTSGGYPTFEYKGNKIVEDMISLCETRGDCVALIDHTNNSSRSLTDKTSVYNVINLNEYAVNSSYATMFTPYCTFQTRYGELALPASFAYLNCLARSIVNNPSWLAIAGAARGKVIGLNSVNTDSIITNAIAEGYQADNSVDINPITNIRPYGQCIWGNRTLVDNSIKGGTTALSFLNIRNLVCDVKKTLYTACQSLLFEQNTDVLWVNFLSKITPKLDQMVSGYGLKNYKIIRQNPSDRTKITVVVRLYPVYAVESFDITVYLQDGDTSVVE